MIASRYKLVLALVLVAGFAAAQTKPAPPPPQTEQQTPQQRQAEISDLQQIQIPPLPPFQPQEPQRIELPNGLVIFLQVDHELPLVGATMRIRGGARAEPANKIGLVSIYGDVWRTGGTTQRTGDQLDDFLEARAAKLETDGGDDSTFISFNCLKEDFDDVFAAFLELLHQPAFRDDKIGLAKRQMDTGIARRNDDLEDIAGREAGKLAYGPQNPYARVPEYSTVAAVTRQDLIAWHQKYVQPQNAILGIWGDFDPAQMEGRLRQALGSWAKGSSPSEPRIQFQPAKPGLYFISKNDVDQSAIRMVMLGTERRNPDLYAIEAMNEVLSGGFASRLFATIRSKLGLAYSVGGGVGTAWDHPGITSFSMGTKSASTAESIRALEDQLKNLLVNPPTTQELQRAKDDILNSFVFNFDSKEKVLYERMRYEFYGYPPDFLERYRAGIEKVTSADLDRVARKYVHPEQLAILVVGNSTDLGNQLQSLNMGPINTIDISIPPPPGAGKPGSASPTSGPGH